MAGDRCDLLCLDLEKAERLRVGRLDAELASRLAAQAKALSDPTRLTLAAALAGSGELGVCDLAWVIERPEKLVSDHVRALRAAGLATSRREGKMVLYGLTAVGHALVGPGSTAQAFDDTPEPRLLRSRDRGRPPAVRGQAWLRAARRAQAAGVGEPGVDDARGVRRRARRHPGQLGVVTWAASSAVEGLASAIVIWRFTGHRTLSATSEAARSAGSPPASSCSRRTSSSRRSAG